MKVVVTSASRKYLILPLLGLLGGIAVPVGLVVLTLLVLLGATTGAAPGTCEVGTAGGAGNNTQRAYEYLATHPELDLKDFQAAAIVGNGIHESGGDPLVTDVVNSIGATGAWQWYDVRRDRLMAHSYRGLHWTNIEFQLDFLRYELTGGRRSNLVALRRTTNIKEATEVFEATFEISGDYASYPKRIAHAESVYARYANQPISGAGAVVECSSEEIDGTLKDPGEGPMDPSNGNLVPRAANLREYVFARWGCDSINRTPCIREIGGQNNRPAGTPQDHTLGLAIDITISDRIREFPDSAQLALGWEIACFIKANATGFGVRYQIWQKLWWHVDGSTGGSANGCTRDKSGWSVYTSASDVTGGHYDHIHITVQPGVGG